MLKLIILTSWIFEARSVLLIMRSSIWKFYEFSEQFDIVEPPSGIEIFVDSKETQSRFRNIVLFTEFIELPNEPNETVLSFSQSIRQI